MTDLRLGVVLNGRDHEEEGGWRNDLGCVRLMEDNGTD